jgi:hypothetical protein
MEEEEVKPSTEPKRYVGELYDFIVERFFYRENALFNENTLNGNENDKKQKAKEFTKNNLARCKSDAEKEQH